MINFSRAVLLASLTLLAACGPAVGQSPFAFSDDGNGHLKLTENDQPVFVYNYGMQLPDGAPDSYKRSSYISPLWDLSGHILSDDGPRDHFHHRGLSWMWPRVIVGGEEYDLWHIQGIHQVFDRWLGQETTAGSATVGVRNSWQLENGQKVLDADVWVRTYASEPKGRAMDVQLTFNALEPVEIIGTPEGQKGYGGFVFRLAPRQETRLSTHEGLEPADTDHLHTPWADESGKFEGAQDFSGIAIFQNDQNVGFPAAWTLRRYGFVGTAWPGMNEGVTIEPGKPLVLRFRVWVHRGDVKEGEVAEHYQEYQSQGAPKFGSGQMSLRGSPE